ncbi:PAP2 superfamily protein [Lutibacter oricola]|uniref:PAP2 superfamily protein n=1 Tax=Lutibacter oricola TaxID=762486 RepID=A0A1H3F1Z2_9FLAO|nr:phosphatase PAP2 family protein [Lutibacter oricola]SDX84885.1 PAP2 superfamily protein [Lutibacter oricola]
MHIKKVVLTTILLVFIITLSIGQQTDSISKKSFWKKSIVPASLLGVGVLLNNSKFEKKLHKDVMSFVGNDFKTSVDDYILFAPIVQMYTADLLGVKSKNHWFDQSKYLFISNVISSGITNRLKVATAKIRPDGTPKAFPSGHTTIAFTNAAVLHQEFKDSSPILAYSGYAFATATGGLRMANNKHWVSDVLAAAGISILVTELVYLIKPLKNFNPFKKTKHLSFYPNYNKGSYGFYASYNF